MRISHRQLADCERDPGGWLTASRAKATGRKPGYDQILRSAIYRFHRTRSADEAERFFRDSIARAKLTNNSRIEQASKALDAYARWYGQSGLVQAECRIRILLAGPHLELRGEVSRVDVLEDGYAGILLGAYSPEWEAELRMPLLQEALAVRYQRAASAFSVGVQRLDGSGRNVRTYSATERNAAVARFKRLGSRVKGMADAAPE